MNKIFGFALLLAAAPLWAQEGPAPGVSAQRDPQAPPLSTPGFYRIAKWDCSTVPWKGWFNKNSVVTDKTEYVHFFWNAQDFKSNFEVKDKKRRLAEAALQLVSRLYPKGAKADLVKVDIVYVLERDAYGLPKWDSLQQVAHLEFFRSKALKLAKEKREPSDAELRKVIDKFDIF